MEWLQPRRRGPEWKKGWAGQTLNSVSSPPPQLLTIFGIVIVLLCFSQNKGHEAQMYRSAANFQLVLFLVPILVFFVMSSYSLGGMFNFRFRQLATARRGASS